MHSGGTSEFCDKYTVALAYAALLGISKISLQNGSAVDADRSADDTGLYGISLAAPADYVDCKLLAHTGAFYTHLSYSQPAHDVCARFRVNPCTAGP